MKTKTTKTRKLTKKQMRLEVVKDALKQMRVRTIQRGKYLRPIDLQGWTPLNMNLNPQEHVKTLEEECQVCALGSCVLSYVKLYDHVDYGQLGRFEDEKFEPWLDPLNTVEILSKVFSPWQLALIEAAFEINTRPPTARHQLKDDFPWGKLDQMEQQLERAYEFGRKIPEAKKRLRAIFKNILDHDGVFVP